jgi:Family of unknown function (DUF5670)
MLGMIAAVLIVLRLLGFFAFHVSTGLIHILLVIGIVILLFQREGPWDAFDGPNREGHAQN